MEKCARCGEEGQDRRTLFMSCFYDMNELGIPFEVIDVVGKIDGVESGRTYFTLRVCKSCRGDWMKVIKNWFNNKPVLVIDNNPIDIQYPVRELGRTVFKTEQEILAMRAKKD